MSEPKRSDLRLLLFYALRYALGRQSTAPADVQNMVRIHVDVLEPADQFQLAEEIDRAPSLGDPVIDAPGWRRLADWLRASAAQVSRPGPGAE